jgi:hypothetical protein
LDVLREAKSLQGLVAKAKPTYVVYRPGNYEIMQKYIGDAAALYEPVWTIKARDGLKFENLGMSYYVIDNSFTIYRLKSSVGK